ncbi:MAG: T9SS type A sorting domain-containing protein [Flavobacteriales bacterium]|nr:T9SS type A sorting domain-containing protein [Flavobacteriales bacterium]
MKQLILMIACLITFFMSHAQWQVYTNDNGNGKILKDPWGVCVQNDTTFWVWYYPSQTNKTVTRITTTTVEHFNSSNSSFPDRYVVNVLHHNNTVWFHTSGGISKFHNGSFKSYDQSHGMRDTFIRKMTLDSKGNVWLALSGGIQSFNGTTFTTHSTTGYADIGINSGDTLYAIPELNPPFLKKDGIANDIEFYDGNNWHKVVDFTVAEDSIFPSPKFNLTNSPEVYLFSSIFDKFYRASYSSIKKFEAPEYFGVKVGQPTAIAENSKGLFVGYGEKTSGDLKGLVWWKDGKAEFLGEGLPEKSIFSISISDNKVAVVYRNTRTNMFGVAIREIPRKLFTEFKKIDINNINAGINANGRLFTTPYSTFKAQFEVPKGDSTHAIFQSNLWVSAKDNSGKLYVAAEKYTGADFYSGTVNTNFTKYRSPITKINQSEIDNHIANHTQTGYKLPDNIKYWPANGDSTLGESKDLAPFVDDNINGYYDPENGDYPWIKGDQAVYFIYNDMADTHSASGGVPIGLEIHGMVYGWNKPNDTALHNTVFIDYTLINRATRDYDSVKVGQFVDFDLGCPQDDYIGCDSLHNTIFIYNGDSIDEDCNGVKGFGANPPVVAMKYLSDSLNSFAYFNNNQSVNGDPNIASEYHNYLHAKWKDTTDLVYGGTGHISSGGTFKTKYMFTGDPANGTGWTEQSSGNFLGDRRGLATIPSFSLKKGERKTLTLAFGYARQTGANSNYLYSIAESKTNLEKAKSFVAANPNPAAPVIATKWSPVPPSMIDDQINPGDTTSIDMHQLKNEIKIYPNPNNGVFHVQSDQDLNSIQIINLNGQLVYSKRLYDDKRNVILAPNLNSGIYFLRYEFETGGKGHSRIVIQ